METPIEILKDTLYQLVALSERDRNAEHRKEAKELIPQYQKAIDILEKPESVKIYEGDDFINNLF